MLVSCSKLSRLATKPISTQIMAEDPRNTQWNNMLQSAYLSFDLGLFFTTWFRFSRWNQYAAMIALTQTVKFWGASFAYSSKKSFSPQAIFEEGITSSFPGSLITTFVYPLTQTHCADRFVCGIEFHSTTIVAIFAPGKKEVCKI